MAAITADKIRPMMFEMKPVKRMKLRLHRKHQRMYRSIFTHHRLIFGDAVFIHSKHMIKQLSTIDKAVKMDTVFFIPKNRRNTFIFRPLHQTPKRMVITLRHIGIRCDFVFPTVFIALPGGFDKEEINFSPTPCPINITQNAMSY